MGASEAVEVSAVLDVATDWRVTVTDAEDNEVWYATGSGSVVSATWPGTSDGSVYTAWVSATPGEGGARSDDDPSEPVAVNTTETPDVLLVSVEERFGWEDTLLPKLAAIVKEKDLTVCTLLPEEATWEKMRPILSKPACRYFYISCHGKWKGAPGEITRLILKADKKLLYAHRWDGSPEPGDPDPNKPGWTVAYAREELNRNGHPFKLAWLNACFSGHIGAYRPEEGDPGWDDYYTGKYGIMSCYEATQGSWNDMAEALGITEEATQSWACGYVGWYTVGSERDSYVGSTQPPGMIMHAWDTLAQGYTFEFTRNLFAEPEWARYYQVPKPDTRHMFTPHMLLAPYFNWRFWGTPNNALF